jgi:methylthioribose-1-phosphate isomerase
LCHRTDRDILSGMTWRSENLNEVQTVWWEPDAVCLIDQTKLPHARETVRCKSVEAVAIRDLVVRGAPAIGITAAYGMALAARNSAATDRTGLLDELVRAKKILDASRSTAVNSSRATGRMLGVAREPDPTAIITERGIVEKPYEKELRCLVQVG